MGHYSQGSGSAVGGGATLSYVYDASNYRVHAVINGTTYEELYNLSGQKVGISLSRRLVQAG